MIPNLTCAYFFRWVCEKPPTTNPFSCCWCSASQNDFPYLEIWKEFGMASSKVSCFFSRQITLRLATFCRNHRSEMLHVWNMYLHLAHIYGKSIGKCSIHEAYADLNRPSYPRQDAFWVAPNASGRCHQWYRQFVLTSNRCNGNPMICMINICIYIYYGVTDDLGIYWEDDWKFYTCCSNMEKRSAIHPHISAVFQKTASSSTWRAWVYCRAGDLPGSVRRGVAGDCSAISTALIESFYHDGANSWGWLGEMYGRCRSRDLLPLPPLSSQLCLPEGNPFLFVNHEAWDNFIWSEL